MNRNLLLVAGALLLWGAGEGMFFNFVPIYLDKRFLLDEREIGLMLSIFAVAMAVTHLPAGHLADRIGRRPLLVAAWVLGLMSTLLMAFAQHLPLYMVGLAGYGLTAFVSSPMGSYVTAARGEWSVGTALAMTTATFSTGMALGPWVGGQVSERFGMQTSYWVAAVMFFLSTLFILAIQRQPLDRHDLETPPLTLWRNRRFVGFLGVVGFAVFAMYLAQPLTPNYLEGVQQLSLTETGSIFAVGALGNAVMAVTLSRMNPRVGFLVAQGLVILFAVCLWRGGGLPVFALGYFLLGGFRAARPMFMAQARELVPASQMGLTYGAMETVSAIIFIITPIVSGYLFSPDPTLVYQIGIVLISVSIVISYLFSPRQVNHA